jgi:hypothetical protein
MVDSQVFSIMTAFASVAAAIYIAVFRSQSRGKVVVLTA